MFKCPTCKTAKDVWYDTKGCYRQEDIYTCQKCGYSFVISAICDKCGSHHSRAYGCNNLDCNSQDYHYGSENREKDRRFRKKFKEMVFKDQKLLKIKRAIKRFNRNFPIP